MIEVFLKSYIAAELAKATGTFGQLEPAGLTGLSTKEHKSVIAGIGEHYQQSSQSKLLRFKNTKRDSLQSIWMLMDCLFYGGFKKAFYKGSDPATKRLFALQFGIMSNKSGVGNEKLIRGWLENIRVARNKTAHHDRFWNWIDLTMHPSSSSCILQMPTGGVMNGEPFRQLESKSLAVFLIMEHFLLKQLGVTYWRTNFIDLMNRCPGIPPKPMGFPDDWQKLPILQ